MNYWLLKSDPDEYGFGDLLRDKKTAWDGVRNPQALGYIAKMAKGDQVLIYHSGKEKCIVGLAEVVRGPYPDPGATDPKPLVVDLRARKKAAQTVTLARIKQNKRFADFPLVRQPRLSVMPVPAILWKALMKMAKL